VEKVHQLHHILHDMYRMSDFSDPTQPSPIQHNPTYAMHSAAWLDWPAHFVQYHLHP
jgi:hypothetical protein